MKATKTTTRPSDAERQDLRFGPYRVLDIIGSGGQGVVYRAEQRAPVWRRVAVKVLHGHGPGAEGHARFDSERRTLALMDHPHIATVLDTGTTEAGQPWIAMELIVGRSLTEHCQQPGADLRARLALFAQVCAGVQHAHHKGIVHRDLKPSNVLITVADGEPRAKLVDFGIAKSLHQPLSSATFATNPGAVMGTLEYMSPEQADGFPDGVDTRSDVYALGAILYELLTGQPPFRREVLVQRGLLEARRTLREVDPPPPSRRVAEQRLGRALREELDWIAMRALAKDPTQRYASAAELGEDVRRFLAGREVQARPPSLGYRVAKLVRRHRAHVAWAAAAGMLALAGVASTLVAWRRSAHSLEQYRLMETSAALAELQRSAVALQPMAARSEAGLTGWLARADQLARRAGELEQATAELESAERAPVLRDYLQDLVGEARDLVSESAPASLRVWMERRLHSLRQRAAAQPLWAAALAHGLTLAPVDDLVPLRGPNPRTGLWELMHRPSGALDAPLPGYDDAGRLAIGADHGIVFVLIPDGDGEPGFLIAKHEVSRRQWYWLTEGDRPSMYDKQGSDRWPVENLDLATLRAGLAAHGMDLPTCAQWCRVAGGGQPEPDPGAGLRDRVNLMEAAYGEHLVGLGLPFEQPDDFPAWHDGFGLLAPIDAMQPNGFGLHHVLGNVAERCQTEDGHVVTRGGSYRDTVAGCSLDAAQPDLVGGRGYVGVRPVLVLARR